MKVTTFEEMAVEGLKDTYDAEHQILGALPKMIEVATAPELKMAFQNHLEQTQGQVARLEKVFELLN